MLFSGASDLLSQIVKPLVNSSNDFSPCAHLLDSPQLSFHLSLLLTTPLHTCWLISPQFHLSIFFSAQSKWHSCKLSCSGQWTFLSMRSWFSTFDCIIILVSCAIVQSYWAVDCYLVPVGPTFKYAWAAQHFFHVRRAVTSRAAMCQERAWAAQPHASLSPAAWKAKRTRTRKQHSCARHRNAARRGKRRQHSRALFFPASFCYASKLSQLKQANSCSVSRTAARSPLKYLTARSRLCRFGTNMPLQHSNMSLSRTAARSPLNTGQPSLVFAVFEQTCHMSLKHANMSVSRTAACSPLNTWQPSRVFAVFEQTCHFNMPTWAWAEQLHAPRWHTWQPDHVYVWNKHATSTWCQHEREQNSCTLPAKYLTAKSRFCSFRANMSLKQNMPTWTWAEQLHAPRRIPDSQVASLQFSSKHVTSTCQHEREQNSCTLPADIPDSQITSTFGTNMPLRHDASMSVSKTAARSPLNTWQPSLVFAVFERTCHLNRTCQHEREQSNCTLPAEYLTAKSRLCSFRANMSHVTFQHEREQNSCTLPAKYLTAKSRFCSFRANMSL